MDWTLAIIHSALRSLGWARLVNCWVIVNG